MIAISSGKNHRASEIVYINIPIPLTFRKQKHVSNPLPIYRGRHRVDPFDSRDVQRIQETKSTHFLCR